MPTLLVMLIVFLVLSGIVYYFTRETFESFIGRNMTRPRLFSYPVVPVPEKKKVFYGRPNKCFSCERDILRNAGEKYINYGFPGKCFSCERQSKCPYNEGPTKCFSCDR